MINQLFITGKIKRINVNEPKDPKKPGSAVLLVQYGKSREANGNAVEFINAVMIRIPSYHYAAVKDDLKVGRRIEIVGHVQGVVKPMMGDGFCMTELVADRVNFADELDGEEN